MTTATSPGKGTQLHSRRLYIVMTTAGCNDEDVPRTRYHTSTQALPPLGDKGHAYARRCRWCNGSLQCRRKNELMGVGVAVPLGWREEQARWARGDQPGACGSGDQRRPRGYVVRDLIPPVACTCSWKLVAGLYCRVVSRPGRAALSLWTHCGNEPRRVVWPPGEHGPSG